MPNVQDFFAKITPRQRAYLVVITLALGVQLFSFALYGPGSPTWLNIMRVMVIAIYLIMLALVIWDFRAWLIHSLGLLICAGWVIFDTLHPWYVEHTLSANGLLETTLLALLAFTFWPAWAAAALMGVILVGLLILVGSSSGKAIDTVLLVIMNVFFTGFMAVYGRQVSVVETQRDMLGKLAYRDPLTQLANRHMADEALKQLSKRPEPQHIALILFDIDHFKHVNDSLGHPAGDQALVHITQVLQSFMRSDDLLARWGGEEFLLLCYGISTKKARERSEQLLSAVRAAPLEGFPPLTLSCGGVMANEALTITALLSLADQRLYQAKAQGRDRAVWGEE